MFIFIHNTIHNTDITYKYVKNIKYKHFFYFYIKKLIDPQFFQDVHILKNEFVIYTWILLHFHL
jgi:hypothetical protein